jgi:hypothetical protein
VADDSYPAKKDNNPSCVASWDCLEPGILDSQR